MVVFGSAYGAFGHIATVRADQGDRYEVNWGTFDLRSVAWPDPAVVGFVLAPPGR